MLATIPSATVLGVDGHPVAVEAHVGSGIPAFTIVGLPDTACREARNRVRAALDTSQLKYPNKTITVNLAPSGLRKAGTSLDLAIAIGVLVAAGSLGPELVAGKAFIGELGLDGSIRGVRGALALVDAAEADQIVVPADSYHEAVLVEGRRIFPVSRLDELLDALRGTIEWPDPPPPPEPTAAAIGEPDLAEVRGQPVARLAVEVAAAGGHHLLLLGPPGAGKTMLARRLPGILPPLDHAAALEATRIASVAGQALGGLVRQPPFRAPHHGASSVSLVGGGTSAARPGEISQAANGVLFLDELGEFPPSVLDALRQPLEEGVIRVARAAIRVTLPARFLLVAAMNPCPCGEGGPTGGRCRCSPAARARYGRRVSGPLLDRFDLRVEVQRLPPEQLLGGRAEESSAVVAARVAAARARAVTRGVRCNGELRGAALEAATPLGHDAATLLDGAVRGGQLSARGLARVRAVALTLADLAEEPAVRVEHLAAALALRATVLTSEERVAC